MTDHARNLKKRLIEGKVFKGGANWRELERFFEMPKEEILEDISSVASPEEIDCMVEQIMANEYYERNVRIIDPTYLESKDNVPSLLTLNSKLCSIMGAEDREAARALMELNYLKIYSPDKSKLSTGRYEEASSLSESEKQMYTAYDYFKCRGNRVLLLTPNNNIIKRAATAGIEASTLESVVG